MNKLLMKWALHYVCMVIVLLSAFIRGSVNNTIFDDAFLEFYTSKRVLVTGGCGFVGSHLVEKLVGYGAYVTIVDDLSTGKKANIESVTDTVAYYHGTICDFDTCRTVTENQDIIFHLAAFISVPLSVEKPHMCHKVNVNGVMNMLEAARLNHVKRFVFFSSSAVYGEDESVHKEGKPTRPISPYGISKLIGEELCKEYAQFFGIETVIMRCFNIYGTRQDPHVPYAAAVAKFRYNMEHNLPLTVFGDGTQKRDFVTVEDVVQASMVLGMVPKEGVQSEVFNIASGRCINVLELIELLKESYPDYCQEIIFMPARSGDVQVSMGDCSKYHALIASHFAV